MYDEESTVNDIIYLYCDYIKHKHNLVAISSSQNKIL